MIQKEQMNQYYLHLHSSVLLHGLCASSLHVLVRHAPRGEILLTVVLFLLWVVSALATFVVAALGSAGRAVIWALAR